VAKTKTPAPRRAGTRDKKATKTQIRRTARWIARTLDGDRAAISLVLKLAALLKKRTRRVGS
jgi:hypothetical protein